MKPSRPKRTRQRAAAKAVVPGFSAETLADVQARIGHKFKNSALLTAAMTHPSAVSAADTVRHSNQRLEFLGDRVLGLVIAERLYERRQTEREGALAPRLNLLVKKGACADAFQYLGLGDYILMAPSEVAGGGRERQGTLGDACEAVIGAVFLDAGLSAARKFIEKGWTPQFNQTTIETKSPKTRLQEWSQGRGLPVPQYVVSDRSGPDHSPVFIVDVTVHGHDAAQGRGKSKQEAERAAAIKLLAALEA